MERDKYDLDGLSRDGVGPDDTFRCPFCGGRARIATFTLDGDVLYQALCDACGTPSYFSDSKQGAMDAWMKETR